MTRVLYVHIYYIPVAENIVAATHDYYSVNLIKIALFFALCPVHCLPNRTRFIFIGFQPFFEKCTNPFRALFLESKRARSYSHLSIFIYFNLHAHALCITLRNYLLCHKNMYFYRFAHIYMGVIIKIARA